MDDRGRSGLRADARRNREQILKAGHELFLELGPGAPLDQIAERAGVGNATLYRRFPTREDLIKQVVIDNMTQVRELARTALATEPDPWTALAGFVHAVVDRRIVALLPILGPHIPPDAQFLEARTALVATVDELLAAARRDGTLRDDVGAGDLIMILATVARPLPAVPDRLTAAIQPRHVGLLLEGLRAPAIVPLPGRPVTAQDITVQLRPDSSGDHEPPAEPSPRPGDARHR